MHYWSLMTIFTVKDHKAWLLCKTMMQEMQVNILIATGSFILAGGLVKFNETTEGTVVKFHF